VRVCRNEMSPEHFYPVASCNTLDWWSNHKKWTGFVGLVYNYLTLTKAGFVVLCAGRMGSDFPQNESQDESAVSELSLFSTSYLVYVVPCDCDESS